jgi:hypothetical protein
VVIKNKTHKNGIDYTDDIILPNWDLKTKTQLLLKNDIWLARLRSCLGSSEATTTQLVNYINSLPC